MNDTPVAVLPEGTTEDKAKIVVQLMRKEKLEELNNSAYREYEPYFSVREVEVLELNKIYRTLQPRISRWVSFIE